MGCECSLDKLKFEINKAIGNYELPQKINDNDILLKTIIQIQSLYRGHSLRKKISYSITEKNSDEINNQKFLFHNKNAKFKITFPKLITLYEFDLLKIKYPPLNDNIKTIFLQNVEYINDNSEYLGEWDPLTGKRHGRGIQKFQNGSKYEGYFIADSASIKGKLTHSNNDIYEGSWKNGKADGYGTYIHNDGAKYEGYWKNDKQDGKGIEIWPDNTRYEGYFIGGKKNGKGLFQWGDGSFYEGEFLENCIEGKGVYTWKDKRVYDGTWKKNEMDGKGVFKWPDGRKYEGNYKNDKKEGFGIYYWPNGQIYKGEWKNGKQNGIGEIYNKDENIWLKAIWEKGKVVNWIDDKNDTGEKLEI